MPSLSHQSFEIGKSLLRPKRGLRFARRGQIGNHWMLIEDDGQFFQIGIPEYTLLSQLDGKTNLDSAIRIISGKLGENAMSDSEAIQFCQWCIDSGLLESPSILADQLEPIDNQNHASKLNPISIKVALGNPDRWVTSMEKGLGILVSTAGALIWILVCLAGLTCLSTNWSEFFSEQTRVFTSADIAWMAGAWILLKFVHESAHAVVCKKFGGAVSEFGILFLLLIPLPYVDVTSSWKFSNKWKRILLSAAGMLAELFVASIAMLVWAIADETALKFHAGNLVVAASVNTLLFNLNPLMRFDGYYILSDWIEIPNLYSQGRAQVHSVLKRVYFGQLSSERAQVAGRSKAFVSLYGFLSWIWSWFVSAGLLLAAWSIFDGVGLLIAATGLLFWIGRPLIQFVRFVFREGLISNAKRFRFCVAAVATTLLIFGLFRFCPAPGAIEAPFVLDFDPNTIVRARTSGFAETIHVKDGQHVTAGDLLISLRNVELEATRVELGLTIEIEKRKIDSLISQSKIVESQMQEVQLEALRKRKMKLDREIEQLSIRAPTTGIVISPKLDDLSETYFAKGASVLSIVSTNMMATALAKQEDSNWLRQLDPTLAVTMKLDGSTNSKLTGRIVDCVPRASERLPHESLAAPYGGRVTVVSRTDETGSDQQYELSEPRIQLKVRIESEPASRLLAGQTGVVSISAREECLGAYFADRLSRSLRKNVKTSHGF